MMEVRTEGQGVISRCLQAGVEWAEGDLGIQVSSLS